MIDLLRQLEERLRSAERNILDAESSLMLALTVCPSYAEDRHLDAALDYVRIAKDALMREDLQRKEGREVAREPF